MLKLLPSFLIAILLLVACVSDGSESDSNTTLDEKNQLTANGSKTNDEQPPLGDSTPKVAAMLISRTFDNENFTVEEGIQTSIYGLKWNLTSNEVALSISEILLKEPLPFGFSIELTDPLEPCGDQSSATFSYNADGKNTLLYAQEEEPFHFYDCRTCIQGVKLQYKEGTYSDREVLDKLFPNLAFKIDAADSLGVADMVQLQPIYPYGDGFIEGVSTLTQFIQYGLFTNYGEEKESGQDLMEFEFEVDWKRAEQGKVVFRDVKVNTEGEREILTEMNWTWEIKGPGKIALFDQNGDRYDVMFTSKTFKEDDNQAPHIQFEWKGKTFTSMALWPC